MSPDQYKEYSEALNKDNGASRDDVMFNMVFTASRFGIPCDICTYSGPVYVNAKFNKNLFYTIHRGNSKLLGRMLKRIPVWDNERKKVEIPFSDLWVVYLMPPNLVTPEHMAEVDLAEADKPWTPDGKTLREMVRETYRPKDDAELETFIRRVIAS